MSQQNNATNFLIQDSHGQPQMIKLVQSSGKSVSGIVTTIPGQHIKLFKSPISGQECAQTFTTGTPTQIIKTISGPKVVTKAVPVGTVAQTLQKGPDGHYIKKAIRLTPQQMQTLKLVHSVSTTPQKIQIQSPQTTNNVIKTIVNSNQKNYHISPPILDHSGGRKRQDSSLELDYTTDSKRRKSEKVGKGLRHFSMKVCEKVRKKGTTTYNEVADELVAEFTNQGINNSLADQQYDQKNIRRRVYDALNVLMAMNIISKEKKEIKWIGLPSNSVQECIQLEREKQKKEQRIREKTKHLQELIMNQISFKNLAKRNMRLESIQGAPSPNSYIQLPFIIVNTDKKTVIDCTISQDKMEYMFDFNDKFEIHDDVEVLKQIGMLMGIDKGECTAENLEKIKSLVPKALEDYVIQLAHGTEDHMEVLDSSSAGPSSLNLYNAEDLVEAQLEEENSRQSSSCDPLSPSAPDFSDEEVDTDLSSDELN